MCGGGVVPAWVMHVVMNGMRWWYNSKYRCTTHGGVQVCVKIEMVVMVVVEEWCNGSVVGQRGRVSHEQINSPRGT